jgi:hypothetical protein
MEIPEHYWRVQEMSLQDRSYRGRIIPGGREIDLKFLPQIYDDPLAPYDEEVARRRNQESIRDSVD